MVNKLTPDEFFADKETSLSPEDFFKGDDYTAEDVKRGEGSFIQNLKDKFSDNQDVRRAAYGIDPNKSFWQGAKDATGIETIPREALQGATGSFADEAMAGIGAGIAYPIQNLRGDDVSYKELYDQGLQSQQKGLREDNENNLGLTIAANLAGGLAPAGAINATKLGTFIKSGISRGLLPAATSAAGKAANLASKTLVGGTTSAASGALYGAGAATPGNRLQGAADNAAISSLVGAGGAALGSVANKLLTPKAVTKTADEIAGEAGSAYRKATESGGVLTDKFTDKFVSQVEKSLPQTEAGKIVSGGDSPVAKLVERVKGLRGREISLDEAQEIDELLGDQIDGLLENGRLTKEGRKVLDIQSSFRNMIDSAEEGDVIGGKIGFNSLKEGRQLWSKSARLRDIEKIISRAEMTDNPATAIKTGFRNLASNPSRMRGYSVAERKLIEKAAKSGIISDTLKTAGSRLIPIVASSGGLGSAAAAQATSLAARSGATRIQVGKAGKVAREIAGVRSVPTRESLFNIPQELPKQIRSDITKLAIKLPPRDAYVILDQLKGMNPEQANMLLEKLQSSPIGGPKKITGE